MVRCVTLGHEDIEATTKGIFHGDDEVYDAAYCDECTRLMVETGEYEPQHPNIEFRPISLSVTPARVDVLGETPVYTLMALETLQMDGILLNHDRVVLFTSPEYLVYQVIGWDAANRALQLRRV